MITPSIARMLAQEHLSKAITGEVLCLGRQLIGMTHEEAVAVLQQEKVKIPIKSIEATKGCIETSNRHSVGKNFITDHAFFKLLGVEKLSSMDVSDYEGADIVHNLNYKIPAALCNRYDFIIDGGTFDHLIDLKQCFENLSNMLKSGGRVLQWNAASNFVGGAYLSFGPDLFRDYYIVNKFSDCKVYIAEGDIWGQLADWDIYYLENAAALQPYISGRIQMVLVLAEKASDSTADRLPVQAHYRPAKIAADFAEGEARLKRSLRPIWVGKKPTKKPGADSTRLSFRRLLGRVKHLFRPRPAAQAANTEPVRAGFTYIGQM
jgi:hypothetical protein